MTHRSSGDPSFFLQTWRAGAAGFSWKGKYYINPFLLWRVVLRNLCKVLVNWLFEIYTFAGRKSPTAYKERRGVDVFISRGWFAHFGRQCWRCRGIHWESVDEVTVDLVTDICHHFSRWKWLKCNRSSLSLSLWLAYGYRHLREVEDSSLDPLILLTTLLCSAIHADTHAIRWH